MTNTDRNQDYVDTQVEFAREKIRKVARDLRRIADSVERRADFKVEKIDSAVSDVLHDVLWGVPNLGLDVLADHATRVHDAEKFRDANSVD